MAKKKQKKKKKVVEQIQRPKDFLDMIAPAAVKFNTDHFILGSRYHTAMALKSYPPMTDELALLRGLGDMGGVNLRLTARQVTPAEEDAILHAATNKSRMERSNTNDYKQSVTADANLRDMAELLAKQRQEKEPFIHKCSLPPIRGTAAAATIARPPIQKAPLTATGLNTRDSSRPAEKANSSRSEPPTMLSPVSANPTQISP